jgi:hypothetical protein
MDFLLPDPAIGHRGGFDGSAGMIREAAHEILPGPVEN